MSNHGHRAPPDESGTVKPLEGGELSLANAIGKYRLLGALGHGGMADVYLAVADGPEGFRKLCVLKLLKETMAQDDDYRAMFLDEARLAARLNHPNIVQTFEVGEIHGRLMIAMEYIEGQSANRVRRRLTPEQFPLTSVIEILCDVCDALDYAHRLTDFDGSPLAIVHRDISPQNIVIGYDARVKLLDFGIAKSSAAMLETQAGVLKGKVGYMAPEQASMRPLDGRADVFSMGVILWEAIAGRRLTEGVGPQEMLLRRCEGGDPRIVEVVPDVDPELGGIVDRAMAFQPEDRYGSAVELQTALEGWLANRTRPSPSRKELARAVREAFAPEREHLRVIVEQRMADSSLSGMRQAISSSGFPSLARLHGTGEGPAMTPRRSTAPVSAPIPLAAVQPSLRPSQPSVTATEVAPPRKSSPVMLVLIGAMMVLLLAVVAIGVRASMSKQPTPIGSTEAMGTGSPPDTATPAHDPAPAATGSGAPPSLVASTPTTAPATLRTKPGAFVPPAKVPPAAHPPTGVAATTAAPPTGLTPPPQSKQPARPLDEKDPYSP